VQSTTSPGALLQRIFQFVAAHSAKFESMKLKKFKQHRDAVGSQLVPSCPLKP